MVAAVVIMVGVGVWKEMELREKEDEVWEVLVVDADRVAVWRKENLISLIVLLVLSLYLHSLVPVVLFIV